MMTTPSIASNSAALRHGVPDQEWYRRPVPFGRLLRVQLGIWRTQRSVLAGSALILVVAVLTAAVAMGSLSGEVTVDAVRKAFTPAYVAYGLLWLAMGAIAGAAPFGSRWSLLVLMVAPRRGRWLGACVLSFLVWVVATTLLFVVLVLAATAAILAVRGHNPATALGLLALAGPMGFAVTLKALVGFLVGAATRSVTAAIIIGYVVASAAPALNLTKARLAEWVDLNAAVEVLSGASDGRGLLPAVTAMCVWIAVPALAAFARLRATIE
jgi:hypothetical protein